MEDYTSKMHLVEWSVEDIPMIKHKAKAVKGKILKIDAKTAARYINLLLVFIPE